MSENRNTSSVFGQDSRGTVCIDTHKVLDACRDRDCFENARVYLTPACEEVLANANSIRARSAKILSAFVGVNEVPFNCGFFQVTVRYYVLVEIEACLGMGKSQTFKGLSILEKDVILFGGEGTVTTFSSNPENSFCVIGNTDNRGTTDPVAIVETVEPIVLGTKIVECPPSCPTNDFLDLPESICDNFDGELNASNGEHPRLYITYGVFSVIRIVRPAQLLIQATDYSVPDKECVPASNDEDPCSVFNNMPFPTSRFRATMCSNNGNESQRSGNGRNGCCGNNR